MFDSMTCQIEHISLNTLDLHLGKSIPDYFYPNLMFSSITRGEMSTAKRELVKSRVMYAISLE